MASEVKIIAALANACGLEWSRCLSNGCVLVRGHDSWHDDAPGYDLSETWYEDVDSLPPTLEAWAAEWAAEHPGEPGPVRSWSPESGGASWRVTARSVMIDCFSISARRPIKSDSAEPWEVTVFGRTSSADVSALARMMRVVDEAIGGEG